MKILQINATNKVGSTGRNTFEMSEQLRKLGEDSIVACSIPSGYEEEYIIGNSLDHKIHAMLSRITGLQAYFSTKSTKRLIAFIDSQEPDVVCIGNVHSNYVNIPMLFTCLAKKDIPTAIVLHDGWFYTGHCFHYTLQKCEKWKTGCCECPQIHGCNVSWFLDTSKKVWKDKKRLVEKVPRLAVIGVSEWITKEAKQSILSSAKIVRRIYNWIDFSKFYPRCQNEICAVRSKYQLEDKYMLLGVATAWDKGKGIDRFIELAEKLEEDMRIVLVGKMPEEVDLPSNIISIGHTTNVKQLAELYSAADVFVTLSFEETFGKVSAEALACGTPIVCYNTTANPELVGEKCGVVVTDAEVGSVLNAIQTVRENGKGYYSETCISYARDNFDMEKNVEEYRKLFTELIQMC